MYETLKDKLMADSKGFRNSICGKFLSLVIMLFIVCGLSSCKNDKTSHKDYDIIPVDTTDNYRDSIKENRDSLSSSKEEKQPDNSNNSVHVSVSSSSESSSSEGYKVDGMSGFDPNYEDPDNNHDMDYYMNETDDEWAN